jgi:hypothetical protein
VEPEPAMQQVHQTSVKALLEDESIVICLFLDFIQAELDLNSSRGSQ